MTTTNRTKNRQDVVDYIAQHGGVFDSRAYYDHYEDVDATEHFRSDNGSICALRRVGQENIKLSEWAGEVFEETGWSVLAEGFFCECGEMRNITLRMPGTIEVVMMKSRGVSRDEILG